MAVKFLTNEQRQQADDGLHLSLSGQMVIGLLFLMALVAFEIFNFDTTRYALDNLLGGVTFAGLRWATVLAIAFCAIDFAGLVRFFLPEEEDAPTPVGVWYLMGAWLLGATMNALMTWWAITLTLLNHSVGNELLSRVQILEIVPLLIAGLVWLTRILFIGAFAISRDPAVEDERTGWSWRAPQHRPGLSHRRQPALPGDRPPLPAMMNARGRAR